jgi:PAS domain S-box-containing protein
MHYIKEKFNSLFQFDEEREYPATFKEELNYQCSKLLLFASCIFLVGMLSYIPIDIKLHPEQPSIILFRLGLTFFGFISLIIYFTNKHQKHSLLLLTLMAAYLEIATSILTGLTKGDSVYIEGQLFLLTLLAVIPILPHSAILLLFISNVIFFVLGFLEGMSFDTISSQYSLRNIIAADVITAFFIFLINNIRYRNWQNSRKTYEQKEELKLYKELITNLPVGVFSLNTDGYLISINPAFSKMCGLNDSNLSGSINIADLFIDPAEQQNINERLISEGQINNIELLLKRMNGAYWWGHLSVSLVRDHNGKVKSIDGIIEDINERKRAEMAILESERRLTDIINFLPLPTMVINMEGNVTAWNHAMEEMTRIKSCDIIGKGNYEYALPFHGKRIPILINYVLSEPDEASPNYKNFHKEGEILIAESYAPKLGKGGIILEGYAATLYDYDGNLTGAIQSIRDITNIRQTETDLKEAKEAAETANRSKSAFLANMSHEIRTPMNAILGFAEILSNKIKDPDLNNYARIILSSGNALLTIINDILDLSKIEAGKMDFQPSYIDLHKIIYDIRHLFIQKANEKGLDFIIEIEHGFPKGVYLDEVRIRQVLMNLTGNAIKFTNKGYVKIGAKLITNPKSDIRLKEIGDTVLDNDKHQEHTPINPPEIFPDKTESKTTETNFISDIIITVEDTGIGIPKDQMEKIFKPFEQVDGQNTRRFGGTGLGLSISKKLINILGGEIEVITEVNYGSKFIITLPNLNSSNDNNVTGSQSDVNELEIEFKPAKLLIVDDISVNRELAKSFLEGYNISVSEAENGEIALEKVTEEEFNLILLDRKMPGMTGEEVAKILKEDEKTRNIPIIIFTASALKDEEREIRNIADGFLTKPVDKLKLIKELKRFLPYNVKTIVSNDETAGTVILHARDLSREEKDKLILKIDKEHHIEWENVQKTKAMGNVKQFARNIQKTAEEYGLNDLMKYSIELLESVNMFKVIKVKTLLNEFQNIINNIKIKL